MKSTHNVKYIVCFDFHVLVYRVLRITLATQAHVTLSDMLKLLFSLLLGCLYFVL